MKVIDFDHPVEYWDRSQALRIGYFQGIILKGRFAGQFILYNKYEEHTIRVTFEQLRDIGQLPTE